MKRAALLALAAIMVAAPSPAPDASHPRQGGAPNTPIVEGRGRVLLDGVSRAPGAPPSASPVPSASPSPTASAFATRRPATVASMSGIASWHATGRDGPYAAACGAFRRALPDWRGSVVTVSGPAGSAIVTVNDWCAHPSRLLDLSDEMFRAIGGPLSRGVVAVTVSW